jgi:membrane protein DedA with SNARE-associated domain
MTALLVGLALFTLASEDLACIAAGALVARGELGFVPATLACLLGIWLGDVGLALLGRGAARSWLRRRIRADAWRRAESWFARRGDAAILLARFVPGMRLPTYVASGILAGSLVRVALLMLLAAVVWVPLLVGAAASVPVPSPVAFVVGALVLVVAIRLATWRGRRALVGFWRRWTRWEFWPRWLFYPPVVAYVAWLALRHRSLWVFTAANPAFPAGGLVGESKRAILEGLADSGAPIAAFRSPDTTEFPVVVKPDVGERGAGVVIARDREALDRALREATREMLIQEYVDGPELGVFWADGRVISITEKRLPFVTGDGRRTVEQLVLDDPRAVAMASVYLERLADRLEEIPRAGERVPLATIGNHCRGAIFLDGARFATPELVGAIAEIARRLPGFHFGRFDLRAPSEEDLLAGRNLRILELNGVLSESTHIYDPRHGVVHAWRTLFAQWRLAFEIGRANVARGTRAATSRDVLRLVARWWRPESGQGQAAVEPAIPASLPDPYVPAPPQLEARARYHAEIGASGSSTDGTERSFPGQASVDPA